MWCGALTGRPSEPNQVRPYSHLKFADHPLAGRRLYIGSVICARKKSETFLRKNST